MSNLSNWCVYEAGPMDCDLDPHSWRDKVTCFLKQYGCRILDPTRKNSSMSLEDDDMRLVRKEWKKRGEYAKLAEVMKKVVSADYRCVDVSDFIICRLDANIPTCGTFYELALAEIQRKPILVFSTSGKNTIPDWIIGIVELEHIFEDMEEMFAYLDKLDKDINTDTTGRFKVL